MDKSCVLSAVGTLSPKCHYFFDSEKLIPLARLYSNDRDGSDKELKQFTKVLNTLDVREKRKLLH